MQPESIVDRCLRNAERAPDAPVFRFLEDGEVESAWLTNASLVRRASGIARYLRAIARPGDRVLLAFHPGLEFVGALYGCFFAGMIAVPIYPPRPRTKAIADLLRMASDCGAELILANDLLAAHLPQWVARYGEREGPKVHATESIPSADLAELGPPGVGGAEIAFLQYTSGSTGNPKGVIVAHENVMANLEIMRRLVNEEEHCEGVSWLPPYHDMGLIAGILVPVFGARPVTLMPPAAFVQKPVRWLQAITKYRASLSGGPNFAYDLCTDWIDEASLDELDLRHWSVACNGAEPVRYSTLQRFAKRFERCGFRFSSFAPAYGMAEATLLIASARGTATVRGGAAPESGADTAADNPFLVSSGLPAPDTEVLVVDPETRRALPEGGQGELWVRSPSVARGYFGKPELTAEVFQAAVADRSGPERYLRTGDLGFYENGELYVAGRIKDVIILRGRKFHPQDLERVVEASHPALRAGHCAAFGMLHDGEEKLGIVQEVERTSMRDLDVPAVLAAIRRDLVAAFDVQPHAIALVRPISLPRTSSGKVRRFRCREQLLDGSLRAVATALRDERRVAGGQAVTHDDPPAGAADSRETVDASA